MLGITIPYFFQALKNLFDNQAMHNRNILCARGTKSNRVKDVNWCFRCFIIIYIITAPQTLLWPYCIFEWIMHTMMLSYFSSGRSTVYKNGTETGWVNPCCIAKMYNKSRKLVEHCIHTQRTSVKLYFLCFFFDNTQGLQFLLFLQQEPLTVFTLIN